MELLSTVTNDYTVVWKELYDSLIFIGIASACTTEALTQVIECAGSAMVMVVGMDEIIAQRNIERLKRELRVCSPVIDRLLDCLDFGDANTNQSTISISGMVKTILTPENHLIKIVLDTFTECIDSMYSCVLIHGKLAVATDSWWTLHPTEIKLLSLLASAEGSSTTSKDTPVFLPFKSPKAAFRFVTCSLLPDVQVCCLCGPEQQLEEIENSAAYCFKSTMEILGSAVQCHPRNFPATIQLDAGILGVLLINVECRKYMMSKNPQPKRIVNGSHRLDILRTFYYQAVLDVLLSLREDVESTVVKETYWCSEYHKCYALKQHGNVLCVLYNANVPTMVMRSLTRATLKVFMAEKQFCW